MWISFYLSSKALKNKKRAIFLSPKPIFLFYLTNPSILFLQKKKTLITYWECMCEMLTRGTILWPMRLVRSQLCNDAKNAWSWCRGKFAENNRESIINASFWSLLRYSIQINSTYSDIPLCFFLRKKLRTRLFIEKYFF
jgi:hypothetical protein